MDKRYSMATVDRMIDYGGSFVKLIAQAYCVADPENTVKLETAFKNYFDEYQQDAEQFCNCGHEMTDGNYGGVCKDCR